MAADPDHQRECTFVEHRDGHCMHAGTLAVAASSSAIESRYVDAANLAFWRTQVWVQCMSTGVEVVAHLQHVSHFAVSSV